MDATRATILSPHLDDAVLSCWHLISGGNAEIVNVFTGAPASSNGINPWWDRMTGATDPRRRMEERVAEDRDALGFAGVQPTNLDFLDEQYRTAEQTVEPIAAAIGERLPEDSVLYAPAAIGSHVDHLLVRSAGLLVAERGIDVRLYADLPQALQFGWPWWVDGAPRRLDAAAWWDEKLRDVEGAARPLAAEVHTLDPEAQERKLEAVLAYKTQLAALDVMFGGLARPDCLGYEVTWTTGAA